MEMGPEQHRSSVCVATTIKQEHVETDPLVSPKQEIEYVCAKEEYPVQQEWEMPDGHSNTQDPLSIEKEECSPSEYFPVPSTSNIEETEDIKDVEKAVSNDRAEELRYEEASIRNCSEPESSSVPAGEEDDSDTDDRGSLDTSMPVQDLGDQADLYGREFLYSCSVCHKKFIRKSYLKNHARTHFNERRFSCGVCYKTFTNSSKLEKHLLQHTFSRPYSCDLCKMTFTHSRKLQQHTQLHVYERSYGCGLCLRTFKERLSLNIHLHKHTGEYSCDLCHKTFQGKRGLKRHMKYHLQDNSYDSLC